MGIDVHCKPTLQISAQIWNFWVLDALCSAAVTCSRRRWNRFIDLIVGGEEPLRLAGRFELLHLPLSSARRLVRVYRSVVEPLVLAMLNAGHDLSFGRAVAGKLVSDHHAGRPTNGYCAFRRWRERVADPHLGFPQGRTSATPSITNRQARAKARRAPAAASAARNCRSRSREKSAIRPRPRLWLVKRFARLFAGGRWIRTLGSSAADD